MSFGPVIHLIKLAYIAKKLKTSLEYIVLSNAEGENQSCSSVARC